MSKESFQSGSNLDLTAVERSLIDLVRVGASGNVAGVRQLANRISKRIPAGVSSPASFRAAIGEALAAATATYTRTPSPLRQAAPESVPRDSDSSFPLALLDPNPSTDEPILEQTAKDAVDALIGERKAMDELRGAGLEPVRTALLYGPPGVGKTMTAVSIAQRLQLPLLTIDLASVMSSYLGRTGQNLRAALDYGRQHAAVVFLDEFDALAKRRDDNSDIGELKRLVNVLLLELERWPSESLLLAATNHRHLLDAAIERRFDRVIQLELPTPSQRELILRSSWPQSGVDDGAFKMVARMADSASGSDLVRLGRSAAKRALLLGEAPLIALIKEVAGQFATSTHRRDVLIRLLHDGLEMSNREIGSIVGVSHPTVGAALRRSRPESHGY